MYRLAIFTSDDGKLVQAVLNACSDGSLAMQPLIVVSNNSSSNALVIAAKAGLKAWHMTPDHYFGSEDILDAVLAQLLEDEVDLILVLGSKSLLGPSMHHAFLDKIFNLTGDEPETIIRTLQEYIDGQES